MTIKRKIFNTKISLENKLTKQLSSIHRKVLLDSLKRDSINLNLYKPFYIDLFSRVNKKIGLVSNIRFYNDTFVVSSVDLMLQSLFNFFTKRDIPVLKEFSIADDIDESTINEVALLLPFKASRDSQFFVQENYERQKMVSQVSDHNLSEEEIMGAIIAGEVIATDRVKMWDAIIDNRTRHDHIVADGQSVLVSEAFRVGGELLMFPGDTSLGASGKNINNCRCTVIYR